MNYKYIIRLVRMVVVLVVQVLVLNHIHILGYVTPLLLGYMILPFHRGAGRVGLLLWGFVTGLIFDVFSNTAGMASASCTLLAMMQPSLLNLFTPRDAAEDFSPNIKTIGFWKYILYSFMGMAILHIIFYALDSFTLQNWQLTLEAICIGSVTATILCVMAELLSKNKE